MPVFYFLPPAHYNVPGISKEIPAAQPSSLFTYHQYITMLFMKPICENCGKALPNECTDAMICTFECTFCAACVSDVLNNICPNCGGGFEKRPTRPNTCVTKYCTANYPVTTEKEFRPVQPEKYKPIQAAFSGVDPRAR